MFKQLLATGLLFVILIITSKYSTGQVTLLYIDGTDNVTLNCGGNYVISEGDTTDGVLYGSNLTDSITICPDGVIGGFVSINIDPQLIPPVFQQLGFQAEWDLDPSDTLYIYDGDNSSAPLIGAYTTNANQNVQAQASFDNPTGCLTLVFVTDGAGSGNGFTGFSNCGFPCQPIEPSIVSDPSMQPADTGYIDICLGDTVWLDGGAYFPYSGTNGGSGYDQTEGSSTFDWSISDGTNIDDTQSIMFIPSQRNGYDVTLSVTDAHGCPETVETRVRVSTLPNFSQLALSMEDSVCLNTTSILLGGLSGNGESTGVQPTETSFIAGGTHAGLTYLPDGTGGSYQTSIEITQFNPGQTVQNVSDIIDVCLDIEHSYLGDLDIQLSCPNGTTIDLVQSIGVSTVGGVFLGDAYDDNIGNPGTGWTYCWGPNALYGTMAAESAAGNTVPVSLGNALPAGTYTPVDPLSDLFGCPINGTWTITVTDNYTFDDGYIFEWGVEFDPSINPSIETYTPTLIESWWDNAPTIVGPLGDTAIQVMQEAPGTYAYTLNVKDDFGCTYDTTVNVVVVPSNELSGNEQSCIDNQVFIEVTNSTYGGEWSANPSTVSFIPDAYNENPEVAATEEGVYTFYYYDNFCEVTDSIEITIANKPDVSVLADTNRVCDALGLMINADAGTTIFEGGNDLTWSPSGFVGSGYDLDASDPNNYVSVDPADSTLVNVSVTASNYCGTSSANFPFQVINCVVRTPNVFNPESTVPANRYFNIVALELHPGNNVKIFDRWGRKRYDTDDYHLHPWDGSGANDGVYYYVLTRPGYEAEVGYVQLIRGS